MERGRDQAENDRNAPDDVIGARQVENVSAEPRAEKRTELWLKNTNPNSVERYRTPKIWATRALVICTLPSHKRPMRTAKTSAVVSVIGTNRKPVMAIARQI